MVKDMCAYFVNIINVQSNLSGRLAFLLNDTFSSNTIMYINLPMV